MLSTLTFLQPGNVSLIVNQTKKLNFSKKNKVDILNYKGEVLTWQSQIFSFSIQSFFLLL